MSKVKIRFEVNGKLIHREIEKPKDSHSVICDLFKEFEDFSQLNFLLNDKWVYGATYEAFR